MLRFQSCACREYEDQADIIIDVGFFQMKDGDEGERRMDRHRLAGLVNLLELATQEFIAKAQAST